MMFHLIKFIYLNGMLQYELLNKISGQLIDLIEWIEGNLCIWNELL